jgi:hypothetical protein
VGKVIGGTKGNKVLEYVSGAPNKAQIVDEVPDIFDYGELAKYGYSVRFFFSLVVLTKLLICTCEIDIHKNRLLIIYILIL